MVLKSALSVFPLRHDLTESTRDMVKRGTDDLKKLAGLQASLVSHYAQRRARSTESGLLACRLVLSWFHFVPTRARTAELTLGVLFACFPLDPPRTTVIRNTALP